MAAFWVQALMQGAGKMARTEYYSPLAREEYDSGCDMNYTGDDTLDINSYTESEF